MIATFYYYYLVYSFLSILIEISIFGLIYGIMYFINDFDKIIK